MSEAINRTQGTKASECSALLRFGRTERCANGFPVNAGCVGIRDAIPICCNERLCGRLYPDTGKPQWGQV